VSERQIGGGGGAQRVRERFEYQISSEYKRGESENKRAIGWECQSSRN